MTGDLTCRGILQVGSPRTATGHKSSIAYSHSPFVSLVVTCHLRAVTALTPASPMALGSGRLSLATGCMRKRRSRRTHERIFFWGRIQVFLGPFLETKLVCVPPPRSGVPLSIKARGTFERLRPYTFPPP